MASFGRGKEGAIYQLDPEQVKKLNDAAVTESIGEFKTNNRARWTAGLQSGIGVHAALVFATAAAVLGTVATAGGLSPLAAMLVGLAAKDAAIATGTTAFLTAIGQIRAKNHERRIRKLPRIRGLA